ncbi:hypothetical protein F511_42438 [Dorcoceras hygrometricum]|uniref:Uncharacterized protein n=1 Tax=Dorcoceras hygrometricum TaxID=472368 RepID=A0A2Z7A8F6_9LAMI|nr:hypothetical protein F511_42438 [Dorcoceras hygrometricum]
MKRSARGEATSYGDSADGLILMTSSVTSSSRKNQQRQKPAKEKDASTFTFQRSVAHLWKEDKIAFWSAEEFLEAFQREEFQQRLYILEATPIEGVFWSCSSCVLQFKVNETLCVRSVGATTILWEIFFDYTVHQQRENNLK